MCWRCGRQAAGHFYHECGAPLTREDYFDLLRLLVFLALMFLLTRGLWAAAREALAC